MPDAVNNPATVEECIQVITSMINVMHQKGLNSHCYYNPSTDVVTDLDALLEQLKQPNAQPDISQIFPANDLPPAYVAPPQPPIAVGVMVIPDPAREAQITEAIESLRLTIARMEGKGLDPHKLYDIKNDKVVDLIALLDGYLNPPQFVV